MISAHSDNNGVDREATGGLAKQTKNSTKTPSALSSPFLPPAGLNSQCFAVKLCVSLCSLF
jgi:hypothetical protein